MLIFNVKFMAKRAILPFMFFLLVFSAGFLIHPGIVRNADEGRIADVPPASDAGKMPAIPVESSPAHHRCKLARFSLEAGQYEQANQAAWQFIREHPESFLLDYAYFYLARSHFNRARYTEARKAIDHLRTHYPQSRLLADAVFLEADTCIFISRITRLRCNGIRR